MSKKNFYITTPIYYVNDKPTIGHTSTTVLCDVLARFKRLDGYDVFFLTGTDEHGQKVKQAADKAGIDPQTFTDQVSQNFRDLAGQMNFSNNDFIRTTEPRHLKACQEIWRKMLASGDIYLGKHAGWYAVRDEAYYGEDELTDGANGKKIAPSGAECEWMEEENYMFRLSAWQDRLLKFYEEHPDFIAPETRRNEVISFVKSGLHDFSVSRTNFDWGLPVPDAPGHVMYVWVDALTNYITALGYPDENAENFKKFWPADVHMVGKDILRFHAVYWPAFLIAAGLAPPKRVYAHGWWTAEGQKMSKSLGNFITPDQLVGRYGVEGARYVLMRGMPLVGDSDFVFAQALLRVNNDLANGIGNLAQRTLSFIYKNCDAKIPQPGTMTSDDTKLLGMVREQMLPALRLEVDKQRVDRMLEQIFEIVGAANGYIDAQAPWSLRKTDPARMATVLYVLCETIRGLGISLQPVIPQSATKLLDQLLIPETERQFMHLSADYALKPGLVIPEPVGIFPRIVEQTEAA